MHMIRNAIDHGMESGKRRVDCSATPAGTDALNGVTNGIKITS